MASDKPSLADRALAMAEVARARDQDDKTRYRLENPELLAWKQELFRAFPGCRDIYFKDFVTGREWQRK